MEHHNAVGREELSDLKEQNKQRDARVVEQDLLVKDLHKQVLNLKQKLIKLDAVELDRNQDDEIYRLREIVDVLNKRIEELRIIVSKEDEHAAVSARILLDKDEYIKELRKQLKHLERSETSSFSFGSMASSKSNNGIKSHPSTTKNSKKNLTTYTPSSFINYPSQVYSSSKKHLTSPRQLPSTPKSQSQQSNLIEKLIKYAAYILVLVTSLTLFLTHMLV